MGRDRTVVQNTSTQQSTPQPTAEETELNKLALEREKATNPLQTQVQLSGLGLVDQLLQGGSLPGYLNKLPSGIDEDAQADLANSAVSDIQPFFNQGGILDSGVNAAISAGVAGDIRRASYETNLNNLFNLLNLAVGGQAQIQQPLLAQSAMLGDRLSGLRSVTQTNTGSQTTTAMNPFLRAFQTSAGQTLGSPWMGSRTGTFGFGR